MRLLFVLIGGGLISLVLIFLGMIMEGGHISSVIQLPAFLLVVGGTIGFAIMAFPRGSLFTALQTVMQPDQSNYKNAVIAFEVFHSMGNATIMTGLIGQIFGLIHIMENLSNPAAIGPGIAISFVPIFYGYMFNLLLTKPLMNRAKQIATTWQKLSLEKTISPRDSDESSEILHLKAKIADLVLELDKNKISA